MENSNVISAEVLNTEHRKQGVKVIMSVMEQYAVRPVCVITNVRKKVWAGFIIAEAEKLGLIASR